MQIGWSHCYILLYISLNNFKATNTFLNEPQIYFTVTWKLHDLTMLLLKTILSFNICKIYIQNILFKQREHRNLIGSVNLPWITKKASGILLKYFVIFWLYLSHLDSISFLSSQILLLLFRHNLSLSVLLSATHSLRSYLLYFYTD